MLVMQNIITVGRSGLVLKTYGYARVSSTEQNEERQVAALNTETYARPDFTGAKPPVPIEKTAAAKAAG